MDNRVVPSLSDDGWVSSTALRANYLLTHFFLSEYSQTSLYPNQITSLPYIIQQNQGDITNTATAIRSALTGYFTKYFNDVSVQTDFVNSSTNSAKTTIRIFLTFSDETGASFNLGKLVNVENSKVVNFANINNSGPAV